MPNLIIMDVMMPNMDRIEACENKKDNRFNETIIMFLSARGEAFHMLPLSMQERMIMF